MSLLVGALANALLAKLLKRLFKVPRPSTEKLDPGMPSSHAHMLSYFAYFVHAQNTEEPLHALSLYLFAVLVCWQRVHRRIHTWAQCLVGLLTGTMGCWLWLEFAHANVQLAIDQALRGENPQETFALLMLICSVIGVGLLGTLGRRLSGKAE